MWKTVSSWVCLWFMYSYNTGSIFIRVKIEDDSICTELYVFKIWKKKWRRVHTIWYYFYKKYCFSICPEVLDFWWISMYAFSACQNDGKHLDFDCSVFIISIPREILRLSEQNDVLLDTSIFTKRKYTVRLLLFHPDCTCFSDEWIMKFTFSERRSSSISQVMCKFMWRSYSDCLQYLIYSSEAKVEKFADFALIIGCTTSSDKLFSHIFISNVYQILSMD